MTPPDERPDDRSIEWQLQPQLSRELPPGFAAAERRSASPRGAWMRPREGTDEAAPPRVGFALSGGGIRSATLCLGFFQGLAKHRLVRFVDYMSTVSGGGYFGAFLGHLIVRLRNCIDKTDADAAKNETPSAAADAALSDPAWRSLQYVRENGFYLAPNGLRDMFAAAAAAFRNWLAVICVVGVAVLLVLTTLTLLRVLALDPLLSRFGVRGIPPWLSTWWVLTAVLAPLLILPPAWSYWLVDTKTPRDEFMAALGRWIPVALVVWLPVLYVQQVDWRAQSAALSGVLVLFAAAAVLTPARLLLARFKERDNDDVMREHLTRGVTRGLSVLVMIAFVALIDTLAAVVTTKLGDRRWGLSLAVGPAALLALRPQLAGAMQVARGANRSATGRVLLLSVIAAIAGAAFLTLLAVLPRFTSVIMPSAVGALGTPMMMLGIPGLFTRSVPAALIVLWLTSLLVVVVTRNLWTFVNGTSLHATYEARLRRAYLGASNPARLDDAERRIPITEPDRDDGLPWARYRPHLHGGPVHLINVTINETVDGRSQIEQFHRKGLHLAVGPAGVSVSVRHHARWVANRKSSKLNDILRGASARFEDGVRRFFRLERIVRADAPHADENDLPPDEAPATQPTERPGDAPPATAAFAIWPERCTPELLAVGQWTAISGAAVSTGLGSRTSLALSLLTGILNVRLGYWWHAGVDPQQRAGTPVRNVVGRSMAALHSMIPVQGTLVSEWLARFPGVARRHWYLTDGGHFENLGAFELLRRRLPVIVVLDNEQDGDFGFDGLANLVRKARTDFGIEITLCDDDLLEEFRHAASLGALPSAIRAAREFRPIEPRPTDRLGHAMVAKLAYPATDERPASVGWMLYVKPCVTGDEPMDVLGYKAAHAEFPHEGTGDQFFGEAQWEAYRRLGQHAAEQLFDGDAGRDLRAWITGDPKYA